MPNHDQTAPKGWKRNRYVMCTKMQCEDGSGLPDEWERGLADSRRPPWIEQRAWFIERRLRRPGYQAHVWLYQKDASHAGYIAAEVLLQQAGISTRKVLCLFPYLSKWDWTMVDYWGDALVAGHLQDFEYGVAEIPPLDWRRALQTSPHHRHYGLMLAHDPRRLIFAMYPAHVASAIKLSLTRAATEAVP